MSAEVSYFNTSCKPSIFIQACKARFIQAN